MFNEKIYSTGMNTNTPLIASTKITGFWYCLFLSEEFSYRILACNNEND